MIRNENEAYIDLLINHLMGFISWNIRGRRSRSSGRSSRRPHIG